MKTMTVKWAQAAIEQAVQRLEEVVKAGDPERAYQVAGMPLSRMDLACLLDIVRQCDSQHSPVREQLLAALPDERDTDQPTLADVADAVRDKLQRRTADCERVLEVLLPVLREHPLSKDDVQGDNLRAGDIAKAAAEALQWSAAEIERLRERDAKTRQALRLDEKWSTQHGALAVRAERDRLREQLATAAVLPHEYEMLERGRTLAADGR